MTPADTDRLAQLAQVAMECPHPVPNVAGMIAMYCFRESIKRGPGVVPEHPGLASYFEAEGLDQAQLAADLAPDWREFYLAAMELTR